MTAVMTTALDEPAAHDPFVARMSTAFLLIAIAGFAPSYWLPLARNELDLPFAIHAHGLLFFGWLVLFRLQAGLVRRGDVALHRMLGLVGTGLAGTMFWAVFALQTILMPRFDARGFHDAARGFSWINASDMILFGLLVASALLNRRRANVHGPLMLSATISLMAVPIGRGLLFLASTAGLLSPETGAPPPLSAALLPHALSWIFVLIAMQHDRRRRGHIRPAYGVALAAMVVQIATLQWVGTSAVWAGASDWLFL